MVVRYFPKGRFWPKTLKNRLGILLLVSTLIPIILIGYISYYYIYVVQVKKINDDMQSFVKTERMEIEKLLNDMNSVSQLLVVDGGVGRDVVDFLSENDGFQQALLFKNVNKSLVNIYSSNPNLGAVFYYFPSLNEPVQFTNIDSVENFSMESLPVLYPANLLSYYGPHPSMNKQDSNLVFSLIRKLEDDQGNAFYVYLETKLGANLKSLFTSEILGLKLIHRINSFDGKELFNNRQMVFGNAEQPDPNLRSFVSTSAAGWQLVISVRESDYRQEIVKWRNQFMIVAFGSLLVSLLLGWLIWRMISRPLHQMNQAINQFSLNLNDQSTIQFDLLEFQHLYGNFQLMRNRIFELIAEVENKEKQRGQLEVEKLLVQINPHFIHNTLNTIQWLARMHGKSDIVDLVTIFTRVLHYNLGKNSIIVTVSEEIEAVCDYINLQSIRYDYTFNVQIHVDPATEGIPLPRFVLQPLVENALYHGMTNDEGRIDVHVELVENGRISLTVSDNGKGITAEKLEQMLLEDTQKEKIGLGIGLRYVRKMLDTYYGQQAKMEITSKLNEGTRIALVIPNRIEEAPNDH
ncbi:HAMP domain-containing protein [Paenibacillus psychroresistens]|uniref:histidine kinase n=1 Tax=Paenibacillus psychroresistens TaxID=1778678 RepID=A0A6B8RQG0_9BACL|nr:histidine kinase [Paenibacillus psychroresistens]QGQ97753.1 HAMP domain-containing protein [Paenibacillus psychroresistens]